MPLAAEDRQKEEEEDDGEICSDFGNDDDDGGDGVTALRIPPKGRMPYTRKEQEAILQYIIRRKAYKQIKGTEMWKVRDGWDGWGVTIVK